MNAHNEQQALPCPFCGWEPDLSFNCVSCGCAASPFIDREDALQVWNTRAAQPSPVVKQNLTTQPAAAHEPICYRWRHSEKEHWQYSDSPRGWEYQPLYAAPVAAAPVDDGMLPDALVPYSKEWYTLCERRFAVDKIKISGDLACAIVDAICARPPSTPAAPGIDNTTPVDRGALQMAINVLRRAGKDEVADALIDASPKGGTLNEQFGSAEGFNVGMLVRDCCEAERADPDHPFTICISVNALTEIARRHALADSPKGGSEARDALRVAYRHLDVDALRVSHRNDLAIIESAMHPQAGDAEVRP